MQNLSSSNFFWGCVYLHDYRESVVKATLAGSTCKIILGCCTQVALSIKFAIFWWCIYLSQTLSIFNLI